MRTVRVAVRLTGHSPLLLRWSSEDDRQVGAAALFRWRLVVSARLVLFETEPDRFLESHHALGRPVVVWKRRPRLRFELVEGPGRFFAAKAHLVVVHHRHLCHA